MSSDIPILGGSNININAFDDENGVSTKTNLHQKAGRSIIHIRLTQRNGRKTITLLHGLPSDLDPKKILKAFKKEFACNGHIEVEEDYGECIKLQGDHRAKIQTLLIEEGICGKDEIQVHGF